MRVSKKRYGSDHSRMETGVGLLSKLLISAPFLAMAFIGVKARSASADFDFVALSQKQNDQVSAYGSVVQASEGVHHHHSLSDAPAVRKLAYRWLEGAKVGLLQPLEPCAFDDTTRDGIKYEIVKANVNVAAALDIISTREADMGESEMAAKDAMLGAAVVEVTKFSDFSSLSVCSIYQRRAIHELKQLWPSLKQPLRGQISREVQRLKVDDDRLGKMAIRLRQLFIQYQLRRGVNLARIEWSQKQVGTSDFLTHRTVAQVAQDIRAKAMGTTDQLVNDLLTNVRLGYVAVLDTDKKVSDLMTAEHVISV